MLKYIHNEHVSVGWAVIVEVVVHGLFALGAFFFGQFLGRLIFGPAGQDIGAYVLAAFVFGAAMQAFVLGEYLQAHVKAFERATKNSAGDYSKAWGELRKIVAGIEVASLLFRFLAVIAADPHSLLAWAQGGVTVGIGLLALRYAYSLAKVIHASVNRPPEYDVGQMRDHMTRSLVKDALDYEDDMTSEEKARTAAGDYSAVDSVSARKNSRRTRAEEEARRQEELRRRREEAEEEEFLRNRGFIDHILHPFGGAQTTEADRLSQSNGSGLGHTPSGFK